MQKRILKSTVLLVAAILVIVAVGLTISSTSASPSKQTAATTPPVKVQVFAPGNGDHAGMGGIGWFIDLDLEFDKSVAKTVKATGLNGFQLTGPGVHNNAQPFPGSFAPGKDDRFPGLVVLLSTTSSKIGGPGENLANLFNITGPTNISSSTIEIWDTWIITAPNFGVGKNSTLLVAEVADLNKDGIFNDAPNKVKDMNNDGKIDDKDLKALGLASNIVKVNFFINK
ncbi:MAG TPA: hypothetical protein VGK02_09900 [Candidatus Aquicultor sp.]|jgi:hypothetical protein